MTSSVLIVDDHGVLADGLALALRADGLSVTVHVPVTAEAVIAAVEGERPAVVLLDLDLGIAGVGGLELIDPLRRLGGRVLVLTGSTDRLLHARCLQAGAAGVASKGEPFERLLEAIGQALGGEPVAGRLHREELLAELRSHERRVEDGLAPFAQLTAREEAVLLALADGMRAAAIAEASYVSLPTVRSHIRSILTKLGVRSQLEAVVLAGDRGWLDVKRRGPSVE